MKHPYLVTVLLLILFLAAQGIGLFVINEFNTEELPYDIERPEINQEAPVTTTGIIFLFVIIATALILLLAKFKLGFLWKIWFGFAVILTLSISFSAFVPSMIAFALALVLTIWRLFWNNVYIHNFTEVFVYGALGAIFAPILTVVIAILLLLVISVYDVIAVNATKHMVTLAKFQTKNKMFSGFYIPYKKEVAILGGGDVAFPLIFAGVLLPIYGLWGALVSIGALIGLIVLFVLAKKKKYYPAMPFVTAGCLLAYLILLIL